MIRDIHTFSLASMKLIIYILTRQFYWGKKFWFGLASSVQTYTVFAGIIFFNEEEEAQSKRWRNKKWKQLKCQLAWEWEMTVVKIWWDVEVVEIVDISIKVEVLSTNQVSAQAAAEVSVDI